MNQAAYLNRIATARSSRPATTSLNAYAQVDRMAKSTNGPFTMKVSGDSSSGREHDLTFIEQGACWLKFTKPAAAGYVVSFESGAPALEPALPLEYLERLILQNELFADTVSFVGVGGDRRQPR